MPKMRLGVFLSGTGTDFTAIAEACAAGTLPATVGLVVSNNPDARGLQVAKGMGIATLVLRREEFAEGSEFAQAMLTALTEQGVNFIALAGYMRKMPSAVVREYRGRIVNIHPALLPDFGGKGMYGINVHEAVIAASVPETGVTIHYVDEIYDHGATVAQRRVAVLTDDNPESLQQRVLEVEHILYPEVLSYLAQRFG